MTWPCFWVDETGEQLVALRRYHSPLAAGDSAPVCTGPSSAHPGWERYHNASVPIGRAPLRRDGDGYSVPIPVEEYRGDGRWPAGCEDCGYLFAAADEWQVWTEVIRRRPGTGQEWPDRQLPAGAMFHALWYPVVHAYPDGIRLMVVLPAPRSNPVQSWWHHWCVDGASTSLGPDGKTRLDGPGWTRVGDPRNPPSLTVTPSVATDAYHGFLQSGTLTDDLGG